MQAKPGIGQEVSVKNLGSSGDEPDHTKAIKGLSVLIFQRAAIKMPW
jgi:hypothetical protein